ncbi:BtrH N-terminal domain-containing protein [Niallia sp. FSL M8-0099]|uniref:BtrH N-terminal domain-containing protein n=1 Tax=Niallia sp. FSL M8-0099 TaxID=2954519 RepID=UPI0030FC7A64
MKLLDNYSVKKGLHCASTSLSEIMNFNGAQLSEGMVLALSNGLDFIYLNQYYENQCRLVFTRSPMLENDFFNTIGVNFKWNNGTPNFDQVKKAIDQNLPILFLTDPSLLPFFKTKIPSAALHTITVIGYDEGGSVYVSDSISSEILECSFDELLSSINVQKPPFYIENLWAIVPKINFIEDLNNKLLLGMKKNAINMLNSNKSRGVMAIKRLSKEVTDWKNLINYEGLCRHVYASIELIGTGGSGFRKIYLSFLNEVKEHLPNFKTDTLIEKCVELISLYKKLARLFYLESIKKEKTYIIRIQEVLNNIYVIETFFWKTMLHEVGNQENKFKKVLYSK